MSVMTSSKEDVSEEVGPPVYEAHGTYAGARVPDAKKKRVRASHTPAASLLATQRTLTLAPPILLAVVL